MTNEEWAHFVASGKPSTITVTRLPSDLCRIIGSSSPAVRLGHDYALKLHRKHKFRLDEFPMLPITLDLGRVISDQPRRLTFFYFEPVIYDAWFQATIKSTGDGTEMWAMTFHRQGIDEVTRMCRQCPILRYDELLLASQNKTDG